MQRSLAHLTDGDHITLMSLPPVKFKFPPPVRLNESDSIPNNRYRVKFKRVVPYSLFAKENELPEVLYTVQRRFWFFFWADITKQISLREANNVMNKLRDTEGNNFYC